MGELGLNNLQRVHITNLLKAAVVPAPHPIKTTSMT